MVVDISRIIDIPKLPFEQSLDQIIDEITLDFDDLKRSVEDSIGTQILTPKLSSLREDLYEVIDRANQSYNKFDSDDLCEMDLNALVQAYEEYLSLVDENYLILNMDCTASATKKYFETSFELLNKLNKNNGSLQRAALKLEIALQDIDVDYDEELVWSEYISDDSEIYKHIDNYHPIYTISVLVDYLYIDETKAKDLYDFYSFSLDVYEKYNNPIDHPLSNPEESAKVKIAKARKILGDFEVQMMLDSF